MTEPVKKTKSMRERARVIARLTGDGKSCREIAKIEGISRKRVQFIAERYCIPAVFALHLQSPRRSGRRPRRRGQGQPGRYDRPHGSHGR